MQESAVTDGLPDDLCQTITERIAAREDTTPVKLTPPLYSAVDLDAVESLLDSLEASHSAGQIEFTYLDYEIRLSPDHTIDIVEV